MFYIFVISVTILPLLGILSYGLHSWRWVRSGWFRTFHLLTMLFISWGLLWDDAHFWLWEESLLCTDCKRLFTIAPPWSIAAAYMVCVLLAMGLYVLVPPRWEGSSPRLRTKKVTPCHTIQDRRVVYRAQEPSDP